MSDETLYCYADVGRTGLGNMLLPWARCEAFREQWGAAMLAPPWTRPKIGPVLRRERDKRYYLGLFNKRTYVRGLARLRVLLTARRVPEEQFVPGEADGGRGGRGNTLVVFAGLGGMFEPLLPHRELLGRRRERML